MMNTNRPLKVLDLCSGLYGWTQAFRDRGHDVVGIEIEEKLNPVLHGDVCHFVGQARALLTVLVEPGWVPDIVLASPPCEGFSVASMGKMWEMTAEGPKPKHETARTGVKVLNAVLAIIAELQPQFFWIENPRAMMRKMPQMRGFRHVEVTQCSYGKPMAKATDLWGRFPDNWQPRPFCNFDASGGVMDPQGHTYTVKQLGSGKDKTFELIDQVGIVTPVPRDGRPTLHGQAGPLRILKDDGQPCHEWAARGFKTGTQGISGSNNRAVIPFDLSMEVCLAVEEALHYVPTGAGTPPKRRMQHIPNVVMLTPGHEVWQCLRCWHYNNLEAKHGE